MTRIIMHFSLVILPSSHHSDAACFPLDRTTLFLEFENSCTPPNSTTKKQAGRIRCQRNEESVWGSRSEDEEFDERQWSGTERRITRFPRRRKRRRSPKKSSPRGRRGREGRRKISRGEEPEEDESKKIRMSLHLVSVIQI